MISTEGLTFDDVLIAPGYSDIESRSECDPRVMFSGEAHHSILTLPVFSANMDTVTEDKMANKMLSLGGRGILHRYMSVDKMLETLNKMEFSTRIPSVGTLKNDRDRIDAILGLKTIHTVCIDIAHGHCKGMKDTIEYIKSADSRINIIAGNVATNVAATDLKKWGADIIKVGIGPGSVCTTRIKTGVGVPQLSAIMNCSGINNFGRHRNPILPVIADGGIRTPGDVAKALAAGAQAVMIGGMLAGTDCVPGWDEAMAKYKILTEGKYADGTADIALQITYRGMASKEARSSFTGTESTNAEGISTTVTAQPVGSTERVLTEIKEGIQSAMSYVGARTLKEYQERATFIKVTPATVVENRPHKEG